MYLEDRCHVDIRNIFTQNPRKIHMVPLFMCSSYIYIFLHSKTKQINKLNCSIQIDRSSSRPLFYNLIIFLKSTLINRETFFVETLLIRLIKYTLTGQSIRHTSKYGVTPTFASRTALVLHGIDST